MFIIVTGAIWSLVFYYDAHRNLIIHFFDVGQGDGIFIELPNHVQVLIDGGPTNAILSKLGNTMPFWDHTIDLVILTHPHADHLDGLIDVLKRYDVGMVMDADVPYASADNAEWRHVLADKKIPIVRAQAGQHIILADNALLDILLPAKDFSDAHLKNVHDAMIVSKLLYGSTTALFMGDAEKSLEYELVYSKIPLAADILKVGHHGSKTSSTDEFLRAVHPRVAVISVGRKNRYGHPHQEVVDRITISGIDLFRTDINGDVEMASDGRRIWKVGSN